MRVETGLLTTVVPLDRVTVAVTLQVPAVAPAFTNPFEIEGAIAPAQAHWVELWLVRSCVLPSLYRPTAVNCWIVFLAMFTAAGNTVIDCRSGFTIKVANPAGAFWPDP